MFQMIRNILVKSGIKKSVAVKTVCSICNKDLNKSFKSDMTVNEMARRHYIEYGEVKSHGYCQECYETHVQSQLDEFKTALAKAV